MKIVKIQPKKHHDDKYTFLRVLYAYSFLLCYEPSYFDLNFWYYHKASNKLRVYMIDHFKCACPEGKMTSQRQWRHWTFFQADLNTLHILYENRKYNSSTFSFHLWNRQTFASTVDLVTYNYKTFKKNILVSSLWFRN